MRLRIQPNKEADRLLKLLKYLATYIVLMELNQLFYFKAGTLSSDVKILGIGRRT